MRLVRTRDFTVDIPITLISSWTNIPLFIRINHSDFQPSDYHAKHHIRPHLLYTTGSANQNIYLTCHNTYEVLVNLLLLSSSNHSVMSFSLQTTTQNCSKYFFLFFTCCNLVQSIVLPAPLGFYIWLTWHVRNRRKKPYLLFSITF